MVLSHRNDSQDAVLPIMRFKAFRKITKSSKKSAEQSLSIDVFPLGSILLREAVSEIATRAVWKLLTTALALEVYGDGDESIVGVLSHSFPDTGSSISCIVRGGFRQGRLFVRKPSGADTRTDHLSATEVLMFLQSIMLWRNINSSVAQGW